jgi:hypothetical protein
MKLKEFLKRLRAKLKKWNSFKTIWLKGTYYQSLFVPGVAAEKSNENIQSLLHFL